MRLASVTVYVTILLTLASPLTADSPISLKVTPRFAHAPAFVRVSLVIERHVDNRQACLDIEGENFARSSCWQHTEGSSYQTVIEYKDLPAGHYVAQGMVLRSGGKEFRTLPEKFRVLGLGEDPELD